MNAIEQKIEFYSRDIDNPFAVNGFKGTWAISDHNLIPDVLHEYLMLYFRESRLARVSLDKINACLNDVWEGPGSLAQVFTRTVEMRKTGRDIPFSSVRTKGSVIEEDPVDTPLSNFGIEDPVDLDSED
jgi:hypothetical protein